MNQKPRRKIRAKGLSATAVAATLGISRDNVCTAEYEAIRKLWRDHRRLRLVDAGILKRGRRIQGKLATALAKGGVASLSASSIGVVVLPSALAEKFKQGEQQ